MATKLPTRDSLGDMPSARTGKAIATIRPAVAEVSGSVERAGEAVGGAAARFGGQLTKLGLTLEEQRQQADRFETERRYQEFKFGQEQDLDQRMRTAQPGQTAGFADEWTSSSYAPNAS